MYNTHMNNTHAHDDAHNVMNANDCERVASHIFATIATTHFHNEHVARFVMFASRDAFDAYEKYHDEHN